MQNQLLLLSPHSALTIYGTTYSMEYGTFIITNSIKVELSKLIDTGK